MTDSTLQRVTDQVLGYDPNALPVPQAQAILRAFIRPLQASEQLAIRAALGRVLARDVLSPIDVPPHDNSAMDGFALCGADLLPTAETRLQVLGTALAGQAFAASVPRGACVRTMTGAVMPAGCDTVVPQELTQTQSDGSICIPPGVLRSGDNRRLRGEDLAQGKVAIAQGKLLRPADLGLLASLGIAEVPVRRRVRVAFFSTGNELRSIGEPLDAGCVYDSNRYTLWGMLQRLDCELLDLGVVADDPAALEAALRHGAENADAIITSGGVSVGEADYTKQVMARLGDVAFWKIAMRPGRPMAFGQIHSNGRKAYLFGLPGNPVAVAITFYLFARDALLQLGGASLQPLPLLRVPCTDALRKKPGRTEYQRGILSADAQGHWQVRITGSQGSGVLRSMSEANCIVVLGHAQGDVQPGEAVDVLAFDGLV